MMGIRTRAGAALAAGAVAATVLAVAAPAAQAALPGPGHAGYAGHAGAAKVVVAKEKAPKGKGDGALPKGAVAFFAKTLHVSPRRAQVALTRLFKLGEGPNGIDPRSAEFARIARGLGVSPKRLNDALVALKKVLGAQKPDKPGKPEPGKPGKPAPAKPQTVG